MLLKNASIRPFNRAILMSTHCLWLKAKITKIMFTPVNPSFASRVGGGLNNIHVSMMNRLEQNGTDFVEIET